MERAETILFCLGSVRSIAGFDPVHPYHKKLYIKL